MEASSIRQGPPAAQSAAESTGWKPADPGPLGLAGFAMTTFVLSMFNSNLVSPKGVAVVFRAKRADRVKIVVWDGSGLVLYWKRLEGSAFKWPPVVDGVMRMNAAQLSALLAGMDWTRMHAPRVPQPKALA